MHRPWSGTCRSSSCRAVSSIRLSSDGNTSRTATSTLISDHRTTTDRYAPWQRSCPACSRPRPTPVPSSKPSGRVTAPKVLPYAAGAHGAMVGSFEILGFPEPIDPDVVYVENMASALFLEEPEAVARYVQVFDYLRATALSPQASGDMIASAAEELA